MYNILRVLFPDRHNQDNFTVNYKFFKIPNSGCIKLHMVELLQASIFGFNLLSTLLLGVVVIYWISMMAGFVGHHTLHIDADLDSDGAADGAVHGILVFFNLGEMPLMLFASLVFLSMWIISVSTKVIFDYNVLISGVLVIPEFIVSLLLVRTALLPFKKLFKSLKAANTDVPVIDRKCILLSDCEPGRVGQAEIATGGASILINVKITGNVSLKKGDSALIIQKDKNVEIYEVIPYKEMTSLLTQEGKNVT